MRRNNERLKQLGLASKDGGGVLGKKKSQPRKRRASTHHESSARVAPQRRSRRSVDKAVSYTETSLRDVMKSDQKVSNNPQANGAEEIAQVPKPSKREGKPNQRLARFVYDEFQKIRQHKKLMLKEAEKNKKSAETEAKYWQKKAAVKEKKVQKAMEAERLRKQQEEEDAIYGTSLRSFVHMLERRSGETHAKIRMYDSGIMVSETRGSFQLWIAKSFLSFLPNTRH